MTHSSNGHSSSRWARRPSRGEPAPTRMLILRAGPGRRGPQRGWRVILVSSGAVSSGRGSSRRPRAHGVQAAGRGGRAAAADGRSTRLQPAAAGHLCCQILDLAVRPALRRPDARARRGATGVPRARASCRSSTATTCIDPDGSDNDSVATGIAVAVGADRLLLLTDVDGVYAGAPGTSPKHAELAVDQLGDVPVARTGTGTGGMGSKLRAAELAAHNGIGHRHRQRPRARRHHRLHRAAQPVGTAVAAVSPARSPDKRWIAGIARSHGALVINREAEQSIARGLEPVRVGHQAGDGQLRRRRRHRDHRPGGRLLARGGARVSSSLLDAGPGAAQRRGRRR